MSLQASFAILRVHVRKSSPCKQFSIIGDSFSGVSAQANFASSSNKSEPLHSPNSPSPPLQRKARAWNPSEVLFAHFSVARRFSTHPIGNFGLCLIIISLSDLGLIALIKLYFRHPIPFFSFTTHTHTLLRHTNANKCIRINANYAHIFGQHRITWNRSLRGIIDTFDWLCLVSQ